MDDKTLQHLQMIAKKLSTRAAAGDTDAAAYLTILQKEAPLPGMPGYDVESLKWNSGESPESLVPDKTYEDYAYERWFRAGVNTTSKTRRFQDPPMGKRKRAPGAANFDK